MSGIAGIYHRSERPVAGADLQRMVDALAHRGPHGADTWRAGNVGLGHRQLWTTPESLHETQPFTGRRGDLVISADARIDNRAALLPLLGLTDRPALAIGDSEVILAAYERWGEDCPDRLLGDFAFAIWDARSQRLFCARDHVGVKPFFYYSSGDVFAFGSELKALIALPEAPHMLDDAKIAEFLAGLFPDTTSTIYKQVQRLAPAHRLTVDASGVTIARYWDFDPDREVRLGSDAEYAEAFRELFTQAVECRLRSAEPVGALLSGGLDSSSIACVARNIQAERRAGLLATFSAVYDQLSACDERPYINAVLAQPGFAPHSIPGDRASLVAELSHILPYEDEPFFAPGLFVTCQLYQSIQQRGVRVLLDGHGGDETVAKGAAYLRELATAGRWLTFADEARAIARLEDVSFAALAWRYVRRYRLGPLAASLPVVGRVRALRHQRRSADVQAQEQAATMFIDPALSARTQLAERLQRQQPFAQTERERHYQDLTGAMQPYAFEVLDRATAAYGIEARYPLWDKRLAEFCLALPARQKLHQGRDRYVFRNAMTGILPAEVQRRTDKTDFISNISRALFSADHERIDALLREPSERLDAYSDRAAVQQSLLRYRARPEQCSPYELFSLWRAVCFALWLRMRQASSAASQPARITSITASILPASSARQSR